MQDSIKLTGRILVEHFRDDILLNNPEWIENVVTTVGKNSLATLLSTTNGANTFVTHIGFGTSTTAVAYTDTILGAEISTSGTGYTRQTVTRTNPSAGVTQYVATLTGLSTPQTIQEAGLFNAVTAGTLIAHQLTGAFALSTSSDSLQITWQLTIG